jgi:hypothetical protein
MRGVVVERVEQVPRGICGAHQTGAGKPVEHFGQQRPPKVPLVTEGAKKDVDLIGRCGGLPWTHKKTVNAGGMPLAEAYSAYGLHRRG